MTRRSLNDLLRDQLLEQGVPSAQTATVTILAHADLTSRDKNAFDILGINSVNRSSPDEQVWRVVPRNPGVHKLELRVTLSGRVASDGEVQGVPVVLVHSVSVISGESFLNGHGPAAIGCLAALALFAYIAWTLWRSARPGFSNG